MYKLDISKEYCLEFLIKGKDLDEGKLRSNVQAIEEEVQIKVKGKWQEHEDEFGCIEFKKKSDKSNSFSLIVKGRYFYVDECHKHISKKLFKDVNFVRLKDELGKEIREKAFPILASIEQDIRSFVHRALTEIGYELEDLLFPVDPRSQSKVKQVNKRRDDEKDAITITFLEATTFEELLFILSLDNSQLGKPFYKEDIDAIIKESQTLEDFKKILEERTNTFTLADILFDHYTELGKKEKNLFDSNNDEIKRIIQIRNSVMHHRPIRYKQLEFTIDFKEKLDQFLSSVDFDISDEEVTELRLEIDKIKPSLSSFGGVFEDMNNIQAMVNRSTVINNFRSMLQSMGNPFEDIDSAEDIDNTTS